MTETSAEGHEGIVVGVDGSECSRQALRWAVKQAGFTRVVVEAVTAWQYPAFYGWAPAAAADTDLAGLARRALTEALTAEFGSEYPGWLRHRVVEGHAGEVLVEASATAELLVVGSRGHGAVADALLGLVSTYCVHHARGPVTVVRPAGDSPRKR
jgi:nucleotide-binding universal stress UspA family protein